MADPTKIPGKNPGPNNGRDGRPVGTNAGPVVRNRRSYPWAWIVAIIVILLIIWAFFSWGNRSQVVNPATGPAPAVSTVR